VELSAILIGIVMLAGIALYVSRPLLQANRVKKSSGVDASALEAQRESLYTQIKELDMDHATGTVNDEDYASQRAILVAQAADVLKQIDGLAATPLSSEDEAEALIAARRKPRLASAATMAAVATATVAAKPTTTTKSADADMEAAIAARRKAASPAISSPACPKCGKPIKSDDAFCAKCGAALQPQAVR